MNVTNCTGLTGVINFRGTDHYNDTTNANPWLYLAWFSKTSSASNQSGWPVRWVGDRYWFREIAVNMATDDAASTRYYLGYLYATGVIMQTMPLDTEATGVSGQKWHKYATGQGFWVAIPQANIPQANN